MARYSHSADTTRQIAHWFFDSPRTAANRLTILLATFYLSTILIPWQAPAILTTTPRGARARADLGLAAKAHAPGRLLHDLTVVAIAAWLLDQDPQATWITERKILRDQLREARPGRPNRSRPSSTPRETENTPKMRLEVSPQGLEP